jgi:hypothetical protein
MNRLYLGGDPRLRTPLEQISLFKSLLDDIFGQRDGHRELNGGGQKNSRKKVTFWPKLGEQHHRLAINLSRQGIGGCTQYGRPNVSVGKDSYRPVILVRYGRQ